MVYNLHQDKTNTGINRYPEIFRYCHEVNQAPKNILSFGCSSGEEVETLAMFFGNSNIYGVEINDRMLETCRLKFLYIDRIKTSKIIYDVGYDFIFCMSVFCRWPDTENIDNSESIYEFSAFNDSLIALDSHLNIGGYMVVYNSNFCFRDSDISSRYVSVGDWIESGFVHKFAKNNEKSLENYTDCVFRKVR